MMKLWKVPFNHIEPPNPSSISSIEYSFLKNTSYPSEEIEEEPVDSVVQMLKSEISKTSKSPTLKPQINYMPPSTTYFLDWIISKNLPSSGEKSFKSVDEMLHNSVITLIKSDATTQLAILIDYLISLIETSRKKINVFDRALRMLILPSDDLLDSKVAEDPDSIILAHQLISFIDREEKLIEKYTTLRTKLVEIDRLNEKLLRKLWRYRKSP